MRERSKHDAPQPLSRSWLPDPSPPDDARVWAQRIDRIMTASDPELQRMKRARVAAEATSWSVMGTWWKPAAALAAASILLLLAIDRVATAPEPSAGSILLEIVASDGDPVAVWQALGIEAEPVLALVAIRDQRESPEEGAPGTFRKDEEQ